MEKLAGIFGVFAFGMIVALLGSIKLKLTPRIGADDAQFGKIVAVLQWTMVAMAIIGGVAIDNFGHRTILVAGIVISALAVVLIGSGKTTSAVMGACVLLGVGGQFVNLGGNTLIPALFQDPSAGSNVGNTFFGLGAFLVPIITATLFQKMEFQKALAVLALVLGVGVIFPLLATLPSAQAGFSADLAVALLSNVVTWMSALTLFCYIGLEVSMASWVTTYAAELGADNARASRMLSYFFIAMMISRLTFGLQDKVTGINLTPNGGYVLATAALVAFVAITMMKNAKDLAGASVAVVLAGVVFGPIFPTTVGVTFRHYPQSQWGTLFGVVFAIGLIGASTIPAWIGSLAKGKSVQAGLNILRVTAIVLAVIAFVLGYLPVRS